MLVPMTKVRILGRRSAADAALGELHRLGLVELADARTAHSLDGLDGAEIRSARGEELAKTLVRIEKLLAESPELPRPAGTVRPLDRPLDLPGLRGRLDSLAAGVEEVGRRLDALRDERLVLPTYLEPLRLLLSLVPVLARLDAEDLRQLGLATVVVVLNTEDERLVDALRTELADTLGTRFELASTRVEDGAMGCLVVFPVESADLVRSILDGSAIRNVALAERFVGLSLTATIEAMQRHLEEIPGEIADARAELLALLVPHAEWLAAVRTAILAELELLTAAGELGATRRAFLAECWIPRSRVDQLRDELDHRLGSAVFVEDTAASPYDPQAPVLMRNVRVSRPFESLVRFLELPRAGSVDPTLLMTILLPLMFGAMVGDVGYGALLLALAILAGRKLASGAAGTPEIAGLVRVLLLGAAWSILFGVLYGEVFGDLGTRIFGDWSLWMERPSAIALEPLLLLAVALGAAHVALGLVLGAWQAIRFREYRVLLDKLGALLALAGLFGLAGWTMGGLPAGALPPAVVLIAVGLVLVMSLHGALGIATGALDLLGRIGNILSYLRIAAVGLASAHLANVANELGSVGPIWIGVFVATFFHALNLALAAFSPMIQSLRLQYVEFFGAFFVGGGRPFTPFGQNETRQIPSTI
ncbi:V-type ATPase 116kDa subunit family protein [Actinophytocola sp.]|uniref:V-type ATP synthase subunit I n=1 Tax=Actinophytocola sp. TaxID=1872138 RepID=UPI0025BDCE7A|nr:V-type ATPase 116kDa subunit family protein [Actinophytocola sp.]